MSEGIGLTLDSVDVLTHPPSIIVFGGPGVGKCLRRGTLVTLLNGRRVAIEEIKVGDRILAFNEHSMLLVPNTVSRTFDNGRREVFTLRLKSGEEVVATANHPFYGRDGWAPLGTFLPGDLVAVPRRMPIEWPADACSQAQLDLARLLGYYLADGVADGSVIITTTKADRQREIVDLATAYGCRAVISKDACAVRITKVDTRQRGVPRGSCSPFMAQLRGWGLEGKQAGGKFIPAEVFTWPKRAVVALLNRYLGCDGCIENRTKIGNDPRVSFSSASERLLRDVAHLLLRFGVRGHVRSKIVAGITYWEWQTNGAESLAALREQIGLQGKVIPYYSPAPSHNDLVPYAIPGKRIRRRGLTARAHLYAYAQQADDATALRWATSDVFWSEVESVTNYGTEQTYDIEVDAHHSFIADDVIVHNSTAVAGACQDALYLQASPDVLRPYETWRLTLKPEEQAKYKTLANLDKKTIEPSDVIAANQKRLGKGPASCWKKLEQILDVFEAAAHAGKNPYGGIVLDEWSVLAARIMEDMKASDLPQFKAQGGKIDVFKVIDGLKAFHRRVLELPMRCGRYVVLVCHAQEPKYYDQNDDKKALELRGQLKYRGGPMLPIGTLVDTVVAMSTFALHMVSEESMSLDGSDSGTRYFLTDGTDTWARKARDFRIGPKIKASDSSLRQILTETAGLHL